MDYQETNASVIRHFAKNLLADRKEHTRREIIRYIESETGRTDFTDGNYSGSLRDLLKEDGYKNSGRGKYIFMGDTEIVVEETTLKESIKNILSTTVERLENEVGKRNPLYLDENDFKDISKVKQIINLIEGEIDKLS